MVRRGRGIPYNEGVILALAVWATASDFKITAPPNDRGLSPFYKKCVTVRGILILSSDKASDQALIAAADICDHLLEHADPKIAVTLSKRIRCAIMSPTEQTLDIPEHSDLQKAFPGTDWNKRARGLGATPERPVVSGAEENLLGLPGDRYKGECIWLHEFSHTVFDEGAVVVNPKLKQRLQTCFDSAIKKGLWQKTYAATNPSEYWAEGAQDYFDCNRSSDPPDGIHNRIRTREQLKSYDPGLYGLLKDVFGNNPWRWKDPAKP